VSTPSSTKTLHVGALLDRAPGPKYVSQLAFAELSLRHPLPKPKSLAQMRKQLPEGFVVALRAPRDSVISSLGALRFTPELETSLAWLLSAADASAASAVLIPTPADFTPGARSRELLREFAARLPRPAGRHYVWLPSGLWEPQETEALAAEYGLVCGFDPLEVRRPYGPVAYGKLRAMGHRTSFSPAALGDALVTLITAETTEAFLSVDAERAFDVAKKLRQIAMASTFDEDEELGPEGGEESDDDDSEFEGGEDDDGDLADSDEDGDGDGDADEDADEDDDDEKRDVQGEP
jgi:uncharacterized protein YecE (DUF72 family)